MANKTALLVVDVQTALVRKHPHCQATLMECLRYLISECRGKEIEVIYVRHSDGPGTETEYGTDGWQIDSQLSPDYERELVIDKNHNSAFKDTRLDEYLQDKLVDTLIVCGMQTEYCIDATVKAAFELGYKVLVPAEGVSTFDNAGLTAEQINTFYEEHIWPGRFAEVEDAKKTLEKIG